MPLLRGYRRSDADVLTGVSGSRELACTWPYGRALGGPHGPDAHEADPRTSLLLVAPATGYVLLYDIDWTDRRAELSVGVRPGARRSLDLLLREGSRVALEELDLRRVGGRTVGDGGFVDEVATAGFVREGVLPDAGWKDGPVPVTYWGKVRDDARTAQH